MNKETKAFALAMLVGTGTGSAVCGVFAHCVFPAHVLFAAIVGALFGALGGATGENIIEAAVTSIISGVVIWFMMVAFAKAKSPSSIHELIVLFGVSILLGGTIGRLTAALTRRR